MLSIRKTIFDILNNTHLMSLAVSDAKGPWVADVVFIYDKDMNIYWMSDPEARHSKTIVLNKKVAASITCSTISKEPNLGIQFEGIAEKLEGIQFKLLIKHLTKRSHPSPKIKDAIKILDGDCWYKLKPKKIYLIDEANFGYDRQELSLKK